VLFAKAFKSQIQDIAEMLEVWDCSKSYLSAGLLQKRMIASNLSIKCMLSGLFKAGFQFLFEVFIHCLILLQLFAPWCLTCLPFKDSSYNFGKKKLKHLAQLSATLSIHVMSHL